MGLKVEKQDGNMALLTISVSPEAFEKAVRNAYLKNKNKISVQGFRKGKAPQALIEKIYGESIFYEDAANELVEESYFKEISESEEGKELKIVSRPEIDVVDMGRGKEFVYTARVALKPAVELGKYKGFRGLKKKPQEVTAEEVDAELQKVREQNSRMVSVEDRPVRDGDIAVIDYEGFESGVPFDGGKGEDHELTIGSHSFIDTFEEQLIGHSVGDHVEVAVTFPAEYHAENLAGKPALFQVDIKAIKVKELPELDDEFASEVSDFETMEEYRADLQAKLLEKKEKEADQNLKDEILKKAVENAKMEIPEAMITYQAEQMVNEYAQRLQMQGLSMDMFLKYTGQTVEKLVDSYKAQAKQRIEGSLVLEAIAEAEQIEVTEEDLAKEIEEMAKTYQMEKDKLAELMSDQEKENLKKDISIRKALDIIAK